jgi:hypothetical protein
LVCFLSLQEFCYIPVWSDIGMANVGGTLDVIATLSMTAGANSSVSHHMNRFYYALTGRGVISVCCLCLLFSLLQSLIVH